jgi:hemoglobin-like flavoprotein
MPLLDLEALESSFELVAPHGDELMDTFYAQLFESVPAVVPLFAGVDLRSQKAMFLRALVLLRASLRDIDAILPALRELGARHVEYGARPEHYPIAGAILIGAMADVAGPRWTAAHEAAWTTALQVVITNMLDGAEAAAPASAA